MEPTPPNQQPQQPPAGTNPPGHGASDPGGYPSAPPPPSRYPAYPQYPGTNQLPHQTPGAGGTSSLAVIGFILSLIGGLLLSAVLCIVALNRIPQHNQRGKGFAIAGLVISGLWLAVIGLAVGFSTDGEPDRDASGKVTATQTTRPNKLRVGDCVTAIKEGDVKDIGVQPCDQVNGGKVFAVFELPAGDWPGLAAVQAAAEKGCTSRFTALKQPPTAPSDIFFLHPTETGWALNDRGTTCLLTPQ
jgi:hypothetical protein